MPIIIMFGGWVRGSFPLLATFERIFMSITDFFLLFIFVSIVMAICGGCDEHGR